MHEQLPFHDGQTLRNPVSFRDAVHGLATAVCLLASLLAGCSKSEELVTEEAELAEPSPDTRPVRGYASRGGSPTRLDERSSAAESSDTPSTAVDDHSAAAEEELAAAQAAAKEAAAAEQDAARATRACDAASSRARAAAARGDAEQAQAASEEASASAQAAETAAESARRSAAKAIAHENRARRLLGDVGAGSAASTESLQETVAEVSKARLAAEMARERAAARSRRASESAAAAQEAVEQATAEAEFAEVREEFNRFSAQAAAQAAEANEAAARVVELRSSAEHALEEFDEAAVKEAVEECEAEANRASESAAQAKRAHAKAREAVARMAELSGNAGAVSDGSAPAGTETTHADDVKAARERMQEASEAVAAAAASNEQAQADASRVYRAGALLGVPVPAEPATQPASDQNEAVAQSGGREPTAIPELPDMEELDSEPKGLDRPTTRPVSRSHEVTGRWRQVAGGNGADFLPGGYSSSVLTFRSDGILEVTRTFGTEGGVSQTYRMDYRWAKDGAELRLGEDEDARPKPAALKGFDMPSRGIHARAASTALPASLSCKRTKEGLIVLGGKTYRLVE